MVEVGRDLECHLVPNSPAKAATPALPSPISAPAGKYASAELSLVLSLVVGGFEMADWTQVGTTFGCQSLRKQATFHSASAFMRIELSFGVGLDRACHTQPKLPARSLLPLPCRAAQHSQITHETRGTELEKIALVV